MAAVCGNESSCCTNSAAATNSRMGLRHGAGPQEAGRQAHKRVVFQAQLIHQVVAHGNIVGLAGIGAIVGLRSKDNARVLRVCEEEMAYSGGEGGLDGWGE